MLADMKRIQLIAVALAAIYFLLAFNAYACLLPLYGGVEVAQGSDCAMPKEQPARQYCDAFTTISVQATSPVLQAVDFSAHAVVAVEPQALRTFLSPSHLNAQPWSASPPTEDILALTSVLRL